MNFKKEILENIRSLPAMSQTNQKIVNVLSTSDPDISEVIRLIQYDPSLTSNVLKLVNSAYFSVQKEVTSLKQAVVMLGLNQVRRVIIAVSFSSIMDKKIPGYDLDSGDLWKHSVATAVASETIANHIRFQDNDLLFTAALLHDIGKIALSTFVDEYFNKIEEEAKRSEESFEVVEKKFFGMDHAEAGAIILKNWGIPMSLYLPVLWHHKPDECKVSSASMVVDIVHLADTLSISGGIGIGRDGLQYRPSATVLSRLNIKKVMLENIISRTMTGMEQIKEIFDI